MPHISDVMPPIAPQPSAVPTSGTKVPPRMPPASTATDTVHISAAAQAMQEAAETPAQTAREASAGDLQAKHLLAREAAEKAN